jgi:hypothetical protein
LHTAATVGCGHTSCPNIFTSGLFFLKVLILFPVLLFATNLQHIPHIFTQSVIEHYIIFWDTDIKILLQTERDRKFPSSWFDNRDGFGRSAVDSAS